MQKIVVSNVRFPEDEWLQLKMAAYSRGMSINEYFKYLSRMDVLVSITGIEKAKPKTRGYKALEELIDFVSKTKSKPMGASEDDKIIYDI